MRLILKENILQVSTASNKGNGKKTVQHPSKHLKKETFCDFCKYRYHFLRGEPDCNVRVGVIMDVQSNGVTDTHTEGEPMSLLDAASTKK